MPAGLGAGDGSPELAGAAPGLAFGKIELVG